METRIITQYLAQVLLVCSFVFTACDLITNPRVNFWATLKYSIANVLLFVSYVLCGGLSCFFDSPFIRQPNWVFSIMVCSYMLLTLFANIRLVREGRGQLSNVAYYSFLNLILYWAGAYHAVFPYPI